MYVSRSIPVDYPQVIYKSIPQGHLPVGSALPEWRMAPDSLRTEKKRRSERRVAALRQIAADRFEGKQSGLADALQRQPDYISRLFSGAKLLDDGLAREFERLLGLPSMALEGGQLPPAALEIAEMFARLSPADQERFAPMIKAVIGPHVTDREVEERMPITKPKHPKK
jgi:hypothetical protein